MTVSSGASSASSRASSRPRCSRRFTVTHFLFRIMERVQYDVPPGSSARPANMKRPRQQLRRNNVPHPCADPDVMSEPEVYVS